MDYIVTRLIKDGAATDRVILFHAPKTRSAATHIKRIEKISDWRCVGQITAEHDHLDLLTQNNGLSDAALFKRTQIDVRRMMPSAS